MQLLKNVLVMFAFPEAPDSYYYRMAKVGQMMKFSCHTKLLEDVDTPESGQSFIYLYNRGLRDEFVHDPRFTVLGKTQSHSLVLSSVTVDDSSYYRCVEDGGLGNKHFYSLTVEGIFYFLHSAAGNNISLSISIVRFKTFHISR